MGPDERVSSSDKLVEEPHYEGVRVPKGKQFILLVFQDSGSAGFDLTLSSNLNAGQLFSAAGVLDEEARGIIRMGKAQRQRIIPAGRA